MVLTNAEREAVRDRQDRLMRSIEIPFRNSIVREKNRFIREQAEKLVINPIISTTDYEHHIQNMSNIFDVYHKRTIRAFSFEVENQVEKQAPISYDLETKQENWEYYFSVWVQQESGRAARQTSATTRRDIQVALDDALAQPDGVNERQFVRDILAVQTKSVFRAETIARTETHNAAMFASKRTAQTIAIDTGLDLKKKWNPARDERTRFSHSVMAPTPPIGLEEQFIVGGEKLDRPGDPVGSAGNVINCLHPDTKVWGVSPNALTRRFYKGVLIRIELANGNNITVTPNHPILTRGGWVIASKLKKGQGVITTKNIKGKIFSDFDVKNILPSIEQVYNSLSIVSVPVGVSGGDVDFHGEALGDKNVDVIFKDGVLRDSVKTRFFDPFQELSLPSADFLKGVELANSLVRIPFVGRFHFAPCFVGGFNLFSFLIHSHFRPFKLLGLRFTAWLDSLRDKHSFNRPPINFKIFRYLINRMTTAKHFNNLGFEFINSGIVGHERIPYEGYVYNLSDDKSYYIGNGIVNHNCRCVLTYETID